MAGGTAKVESVEALKALRRTLFKFAEGANTALTDAESELTRTLLWIQTEQISYWTLQIRKRTELVGRCEEAVRMKKLFTDAAGRRSSAIDEIKALEKAKRSLAVAHEKMAACKMWSRKLEKEIQNYRGAVQRFATTVQADLPVAAAKLENAIIRLEQYLSLGVPSEQVSTAGVTGSEAAAGAPADLSSMARAADEEVEEVAPQAPTEAQKNADS